MKLFHSMFFGALVTLGIALFGYGAVSTINFLGKVDPIYPLVLLVVGAWVFCTAIFYTTK